MRLLKRWWLAGRVISHVLLQATFAPLLWGKSTDIYGTRSLALSNAYRALADSNEAVILNPAGMVFYKRYHIELQYGYKHKSPSNVWCASLVDSKSTPLAVGAGYFRDVSSQPKLTLNRFYFASAYAVSDRLALGMGSVFKSGDIQNANDIQNATLVNGTAGLLMRLGEFVRAALVYQNFVPKQDRPLQLPPTLALGLAAQTMRLGLALDATMQLLPGVDKKYTLHGGAEAVPLEWLALRAGYQMALAKTISHVLGQSVSAGLALLSPQGTLNAACSIDLAKQPTWQCLAGVGFYL